MLGSGGSPRAGEGVARGGTRGAGPAHGSPTPAAALAAQAWRVLITVTVAAVAFKLNIVEVVETFVPVHLKREERAKVLRWIPGKLRFKTPRQKISKLETRQLIAEISK